MSLLTFFGIEKYGLTPIILITGFVLICVAFYLNWKYKFNARRKEAGLSWIAFIPRLGNFAKRNASNAEYNKAHEGKKYAPTEMELDLRRVEFKRFIQDLPSYCIEDDFFSRLIRSIMSKGGATYQQVVLHDASSISDTYVYVRKEGNYFLHNNGIYLFPWDYQKDILHWDIQDCRPMIDRSPQVKWESKKMNARYFWGIVNSVAMGKEEGIGKNTMTIILILIALSVVIGIYNVYTIGQNQDQIINALKIIANNTQP